jgi:hypothetical protein
MQIYKSLQRSKVTKKSKKRTRSHTTTEIKVPQFFACWLKDSEPCKLLRYRTDPDLRGPKNIRIRNWCLQFLPCPMSQNEFYFNSIATSKCKIGRYTYTSLYLPTFQTFGTVHDKFINSFTVPYKYNLWCTLRYQIQYGIYLPIKARLSGSYFEYGPDPLCSLSFVMMATVAGVHSVQCRIHSVVDRLRFEADLDPTYHFDADPDPDPEMARSKILLRTSIHTNDSMK